MTAGFNTSAGIGLVLLLSMSGTALLAQVVPPPAADPKRTIPEKVVPEGTQPRHLNPSPSPQDTPTIAPSEKKDGVLTPPNSEMDPGIHAPAPVPDPGTTPVIPPPGSRGGSPDVTPE